MITTPRPGHQSTDRGLAALHHVIPWRAGGCTDLQNLVALCDRHHDRHEADGWTIHIDNDGIPWFTPPAWIDPQQKPRRHERFTPPPDKLPDTPAETPPATPAATPAEEPPEPARDEARDKTPDKPPDPTPD